MDVDSALYSVLKLSVYLFSATEQHAGYSRKIPVDVSRLYYIIETDLCRFQVAAPPTFHTKYSYHQYHFQGNG